MWLDSRNSHHISIELISLSSAQIATTHRMHTDCVSYFYFVVLLREGNALICFHSYRFHIIQQVMSDVDVLVSSNGVVPGVDEEKQEQSEQHEETTGEDKGLWRDLLAFWFLGMTNNYGYVVMLSAALDIIEHFSHNEVSMHPDPS